MLLSFPFQMGYDMAKFGWMNIYKSKGGTYFIDGGGEGGVDRVIKGL